MSTAACNYAIPAKDCTLQTCCMLPATVQYLPNVTANALYASIFLLLLIGQVGLGAWYRTWLFSIGMFGGLMLETLGYAGRVWMHYEILAMDPFLMYLICITLGPALIAASIYLCLSRIVALYPPSLSRFQPKTYTHLFMSSDLVSLILQGVGGATASLAGPSHPKQLHMGVNVMVAGLASQVFSLLLFIALSVEFALRVRHNKSTQSAQEGTNGGLQKSKRLKWLVFALATATILIFVRSVYRVAELEEGFNSGLANDEVLFMILEGPMIIIATTALTAFHPGFCLGRESNSIGMGQNTREVEEAAETEENVQSAKL